MASVARCANHLDELLRGDATRPELLRGSTLPLPAGEMAGVALVLAAGYGVCAGSYALIRTGGSADGWMQLLASAVKFPALLFLTLAVTFPSLYVFSAIAGSRLRLGAVFRLLVAMVALLAAVVASLGPIVVFFGLSTTSYGFMVLLNVAAAGTAGVLGITFLVRTLHRLIAAAEAADFDSPEPAEAPGVALETSDDLDKSVKPLERQHEDSSEPAAAAAEAPEAKPDVAENAMRSPRIAENGPLRRNGEATHARASTVFRVWLLLFVVVGAQMSWVLRPFIGNPDDGFAWFRPRDGNFYAAVMSSLARVLGFDG